jgi:hypothetical protein
MQEIRLLGTNVVIDSLTSVQYTVVLKQGPHTETLGPITFNLAASTARWSSFVQTLLFALRATLAAAIAGNANLIQTSPYPDIDVTVTPTPGAGTLEISLQFINANCVFAISGLPAVLFSVELDNGTGIWSKIGLLPEVDANIIELGPQPTFDSQFQPRSIFCFERSEVDTGDYEQTSGYATHRLASGQTRSYDLGSHIFTRTYTLVDQDYDMAGPAVHIGLLSSSPINGNRDTLNFTDFTSLPNQTASGFTNLGYTEEKVELNRYISIGGRWVGRVRAKTATSIQLWDTVPADIQVVPQLEITQISEAHALWFEAIRLGTMHIYGMDEETGQPYYNAASYAIASGEPNFQPTRLDIGNALYSKTFDLIKKELPT